MTRNVELLPSHQYYYFDNNNELCIGEYDLEVLREIKLLAIKEWYEKAKKEPVMYNGELFDFDEVSQQRVSTIALANIGSPTGTWTTANNTDVSADANFMRGLFQAMITKVGFLHSEQRRMKTELAALTTAEEIANYGVPVL